MSSVLDLGQEQREWHFNHYQECLKVLTQYNIDPEDICFVGGMSLSAVNLRENNDVDFVVRSTIRDEIIEKWSLSPKGRSETYYSLSENVDLKSNWASCIGISDDELVLDERYYFRRGGFKVAKLEVTFSRKNSIRREHDKRDISLIEEYILDPTSVYDWNWDLFREPTKEGRNKFTRLKRIIITQFKSKPLFTAIKGLFLSSMRLLLKKTGHTIRKHCMWHWKLKHFSIINGGGGSN